MKTDKKKTEIKQNNMDATIKNKNEPKQVNKKKYFGGQARNAKSQKAKTEQRFKLRNNALNTKIKNPFMQKILADFFDEIGANQNERELLEWKLKPLGIKLIITVSYYGRVQLDSLNIQILSFR